MSPLLGNAWATPATDAARALLDALLTGNALEQRLVDALVEAVLARPCARLAVEVRQGGPFAVRRAIELAALVLTQPTSAEADSAGTGGGAQ